MGLTGWLIFTGVILVLGALVVWLLTRPTRRERARRTEVTRRLTDAQRREEGRAVVGEALRKPPHVVAPARVNTTPRPSADRQTPAGVPDPVDFTSPTSYPGGSAYTAGTWHGSHHGPASSGAEAGGTIGHSGGHHSSHDSGSSSGGSYDSGSSGYDSGSSGGGDSGGSW